MSDPVAAGLVKSLGRPEGNLTGVTSRSPGLSAKRLELSVAVVGLLVLPDTVFIQHFKRLVELAARQRIPATYWAKEPVEAGGLMSYGASFQDQFRIAAGYIDKILKGAKPADLPIEGPTAFELVINLRTARALGLTIPQSLLMRANEIVQ